MIDSSSRGWGRIQNSTFKRPVARVLEICDNEAALTGTSAGSSMSSNCHAINTLSAAIGWYGLIARIEWIAT